MMAADALESLLAGRQVWRSGRVPAAPAEGVPSGLAALDEALPWRGWPVGALTELLLPADGIGELALLWPALARLSRAGGQVVLVAPPYMPYPPAWVAAGVRLDALQLVDADQSGALWAAEQCLRSGACAAVLCWPRTGDDRALRRLQVAAETGRANGFVFRPARMACNPSPAALRIALEPGTPSRLRVVKCRGAAVPQPIEFRRAVG